MTTTVVSLERATYTAREVAALYGVGKDTVYERVKTGEFPVKPIPGLGGRVLFSRAAVHADLGIQPDQTP
jgi:excisionase family DNA binding protein